jgi:prepilin-type N-terminal cleavage/methylation domain-containing protein
MGRQKKAFTLIEVILVVLLLGIVAVIAVPRISFSVSSGQKADSLAKKLTTDLRRTRMLAISNAATNPTGFTLKMTGSAPFYSGYQIIDDSNSTVVNSQTIGSKIMFTGSSQFSFGPLGSLRNTSSTLLMLQIIIQNRYYKISITSATGIVKCNRFS